MRVGRLVAPALAAVLAGAAATGATIASANGTHSAAAARHAAKKSKRKAKNKKHHRHHKKLHRHHSKGPVVKGTINLEKTKYGKILVDSEGYTVYMWVKDSPNSKKTACDEPCLTVWPLVTTTGTPKAGTGVKQKLLGTFEVEGKTEVTYNGWPLYTFVSDNRPGEITGQDNTSFGGPWYVLDAAGNPITKPPKQNYIEGELERHETEEEP